MSVRIGDILVAHCLKQTLDRSTGLRMLQNAVYLVKSNPASSFNFHLVEYDVKAASPPSAIFNRDLLSIDSELSFGSERHRHTPRSMVRGVHSQLTFDHT